MKLLNEEKVIEYINNDLVSDSPIYCDELYPYYEIDPFNENIRKSIFTIEFLKKYERVSKEFWEMQELLKDALREYEDIKEKIESEEENK